MRLMVKEGLTPDLLVLLSAALKALGLFGAAGARARRGFGSLSLESLRVDGEEKWPAPRNVQELRDCMRKLLKEIRLNQDNSREPDYTAFGAQTRISIVRTERNPVDLLDAIGKELLRYRSYGHKNKNASVHVLPWHERAEQNFAGDHDLILDFLKGQFRRSQGHPCRIVFGLPHNYFFLSTKQKAFVEGVNYKRRASPLFIHIHALPAREYAAVFTFLPALFLPAGEQIKISDNRRRTVELDCRVNYQYVENFFNRPAFQNGVMVWP